MSQKTVKTGRKTGNTGTLPILTGILLFLTARPGATVPTAGGIVDDQYLFVDEKSCNDKKQSYFHKKRSCFEDHLHFPTLGRQVEQSF